MSPLLPYRSNISFGQLRVYLHNNWRSTLLVVFCQICPVCGGSIPLHSSRTALNLQAGLMSTEDSKIAGGPLRAVHLLVGPSPAHQMIAMRLTA